MKAVFISKHGGLDKLVYGDRPQPALAPGEVMLRVQGSALNQFVAVERRADGLKQLKGHNHRSGIGIEQLLTVSTEPEVCSDG